MGQNSNIEWTHHTFNAWRGCTKVSDGCKNCYADTLSKRNPGTLGIWGPNGTRVVAAESYWREPLKWDKAAAQAGERHRVFCASLADVFENWKGAMTNTSGKYGWIQNGIDWDFYKLSSAQVDFETKGFVPMRMVHVLCRLLDVIRRTPHLDWLLLTKRPENWREMIEQCIIIAQGGDPDNKNYFQDHDGDFPASELSEWLNEWTGGNPPANVWLGASVENQPTADQRIPHLLKCPAAVRFLSCEPLLGGIDFDQIQCSPAPGFFGNPLQWFHRGKSHLDAGINYPTINWVIVGGESGRREDETFNAENLVSESAGHAIARNPGVTLLWTTRDYRTFSDGNGSWLIKLGEPTAVKWYSKGRLAMRAEVEHSVYTGYQILMDMAKQQGDEAVFELMLAEKQLRFLYPK